LAELTSGQNDDLQQVPRFVTAKVVAKVFDITTAQVYTLTREGILPACRLGRAIRYDVRELEQFAQTGGRGFEHGWRREAPE